MDQDGYEYRIDFTIERRRPGEDFTEVRYGSSGAWSSIDQAAHIVQSAVQNGEWETTAGMPDQAELTA